ncbi:uncharacterized protein LOC130988474 [Salvia miltiorrhiza]|uniref:uncharacterized protein LOC130988474 n=1 Tax=Salvia miltiorrhiza TaxID=226208 RepID=UPI0025AD8BF6|nr:uncharacterized protein LOC130988474 [Salvia miltiorrhiza]
MNSDFSNKILSGFELSTNFAYRGQGRGIFPPRGGFNRSIPSTKSIMCQLCGRSGHVALKRFKRFEINFTDNTTPQAFFSDVQQSPPITSVDVVASQDLSAVCVTQTRHLGQGIRVDTTRHVVGHWILVRLVTFISDTTFLAQGIVWMEKKA